MLTTQLQVSGISRQKKWSHVSAFQTFQHWAFSTFLFKRTWICNLSHTRVTLVTIVLLTLWKVVFRNWDAVVIFPSFLLFYNRHISLKWAYIEEVMICECDGYRWMGPSLSSVALTTSTVEDRFSFTGDKDIREHFVLCLRIQPWIWLSCICGRHISKFL